MSRTLRKLYELLGVHSIRTSVYHPQTDGLVERFNKTLKNMVRKFVHEDSRNWDNWLDPLLFAVREAEVGVSPTCASHEQVSSFNLQVSSKSQVTVVRVKQVKSSHCSGQASHKSSHTKF